MKIRLDRLVAAIEALRSSCQSYDIQCLPAETVIDINITEADLAKGVPISLLELTVEPKSVKYPDIHYHRKMEVFDDMDNKESVLTETQTKSIQPRK